jgi:hypothetical protein
MRIYDHENHCYINKRAEYKLVNHLANTKGKHDSRMAEKQPNGLYIWWLFGFLALAIMCKSEAKAEPVCLFHIAGYCI